MVITFKNLGSYGRLGNQMFQYATLKSIGIRNKFKVKIPNGNYSLRRLNINSDTLSRQDIVRIKKNYQERFFHYDEGVFGISDWTNIYGYFQSYKYFDSIKEVLLEEFIDLKKLDKVFDVLSNGVNIGVHVRRTDYLRLTNVHPFPRLRYYNRCFNFFRNRFSNCKFYILSDDIGWCRKNFKGRDFLFFGNDEVFDLMLMMSCDHNIIANSSYSWWGAYLNSNKDKIVFYPKVWMGPGGPQDYYDLVPGGWRKI